MRVQFAVAIALALALSSALAQPQIKVVGVFALLGDSVQVTAATDAPSDTRIERTARETLEFKGIGFDLIALRSANSTLQGASPGVQVKMYRAPIEQSLSEQRRIADGAHRGELPAWMIEVVQSQKLSHVLLVTRSRGDPNIRTGEGFSIGRGTVDGVGFYLDTLYRMRNVTTGALSTGLIAPYVQLRLTLMDTDTAKVVASYDVRDARAVAAPSEQVVPDPWTFMSAQDKVISLRQMVEQGVARGVQNMLKPN